MTPAGDYAVRTEGTPMALQGDRYATQWQAPRTAGTWVLAVRLPDGTVRTVRVELR
jgi:hypothetical protein